MRTPIAVGLITLIALTSISHAELAGDVEVNAGWVLMDGNSIGSNEDRDYPSVEAALRLAQTLGTNGWAVQGDLILEKLFVESGKDDSPANSIVAGLHLYKANSNALVGVFASAAHVDLHGTDDALTYLVGLEAQKYFENITLYGQAFYLNELIDDAEDPIQNAFGLRGVCRYFVNDNMKIEGDITVAQGKMDADDDRADIYGFSLTAEQQLGDGPISLFAQYAGTHHYQSGSEKDRIETHGLYVGIRWLFGEPQTLKAADRNGARLDLPAYQRWLGITGGQLE